MILVLTVTHLNLLGQSEEDISELPDHLPRNTR